MDSHICCAPVPSPSSNRPPLRMSRVDAVRAITAGGRSGRLSRLGSTVIRRVLATMADSSAMVSSRSGQYGWSDNVTRS